MAAILWSDVVAFAPEMAAVPILAQTVILDYVNQTMSVVIFGGEDTPKTKFARILLAAHLGKVGALTGIAVGILTGQSEGGLSQSYTLPPIPTSGTDAFWARSGYGLTFASLMRTSPRARLPMVL